MGSEDDRKRFLTQVRKACAIGRQMREMGIRPTGGVRIDSSTGVEAWDKDPAGGTKLIAETFREAGRIAKDHGEFLVAEGEICWGGMHSWREMVKLLELVDMPGVVGYQADMAHSMLYTLGSNREQDRILPEGLSTGRTAPSSTPPTARSPMRCGPGRSTSTSRRTTARCSAPATTRRPAAIAASPTRTASSISSSMPATGCATTRASSPRRCATSAGTAACSPMP